MKHLSYLLSIVCMLSFTLTALANDPPPQDRTMSPWLSVDPKQEADREIMRAYNLESLNLGNGREAANLVIQTAKMVLPDVRFMVDIPNNMLIVHGSNADHEKLLDVLHQLQNPQALPERAALRAALQPEQRAEFARLTEFFRRLPAEHQRIVERHFEVSRIHQFPVEMQLDTMRRWMRQFQSPQYLSEERNAQRTELTTLIAQFPNERRQLEVLLSQSLNFPPDIQQVFERNLLEHLRAGGTRQDLRLETFLPPAGVQMLHSTSAQERSGVSPPVQSLTRTYAIVSHVPGQIAQWGSPLPPTPAVATCPSPELQAQRERAYVTIARQYFQIVNTHAMLVRDRMLRQMHHPRSLGDHEMNDDGLKEKAAVAVERFANTFKKISPMMQTELVIELAGTTFCVEALTVLETLLDDICVPMPERPGTSFAVEHGLPHVVFVPQRVVQHVGPLPATLCDDDEICCPPPTAPVREYRITPPAPVSAPRAVNY